MIKFMVLTILLIPHYLLAKEYQLEMFFTTNNISMDLPSNNKYIHVSAPAVWKDSNGDYGNLICYGRIITNKNTGTELDLFCSAKNQENDKFWFRMIRNSKEMDAGIGISEYIDGTGKYNQFKGMQCKYAARLFEINSLINQKCKFPNK